MHHIRHMGNASHRVRYTFLLDAITRVQRQAEARLRTLLCLCMFMLMTTVFSMSGPLPHVCAQPSLGDILIIDSNAGTSSMGALFQVNPVTGARMLLSDFGVVAQGPLGTDPVGVALEASGDILVTDSNAGTSGRGALFWVHPVTGVRTLLSDFGAAAQGPLGAGPFGVALEASGDILVIDAHVGAIPIPTINQAGALFRVHPVTGARTLLSDFGAAAQGPLGAGPFGVALEASGDILVIDVDANALFRVDPATGGRTLLSDFGNDPVGVALEASGAILVTDLHSGPVARGALFRVNPATGASTLLSDFGAAAQGPLGRDPWGVAVVLTLSDADDDDDGVLDTSTARQKSSAGL